MLHQIKELQGYQLRSLDGEMGKVKEFYFDDRHWAVRYLVADTDFWLPGRQVLISPYSLSYVNQAERTVSVELTKKQIENSPGLDSDRPVSRQFEESYYGYYQLPVYWTGSYMWGAYPFFVRDREKRPAPQPSNQAEDYHLRSTDAVTGHHIQALDGEVGHVGDFILQDLNWAIRYLVVDTTNWLPGKKVLIAPSWIERIDWGEKKVFVNLTRDQIRKSPEFTQNSLSNKDYEPELHQHYNRPGYWVGELAAREKSAAAGEQRDSRLEHEIKH